MSSVLQPWYLSVAPSIPQSENPASPASQARLIMTGDSFLPASTCWEGTGLSSHQPFLPWTPGHCQAHQLLPDPLLHLPPLSSNGSRQRLSVLRMYKHMSSVSRSKGNSIRNSVCICKLKICTIMSRAIQTNNYINSRYGWHGNYNRYFQQI